MVQASAAQAPGVGKAPWAVDVHRAPHSADQTKDTPGTLDATRLDDLRRQFKGKATAAIFGEAVGLFMRSPEHRDMTLAELDRLLIPAIRHKQILFAHMKDKNTGETLPAGVIIWAEVSRNVAKRLERQGDGERLELEAKDWRSGKTIWLVDAAGPDQVVQKLVGKLVESAGGSETCRFAANLRRFIEAAEGKCRISGEGESTSEARGT